MAVDLWYHGTDSTETISVCGLDPGVTLGTPGSDDRGFFVTPHEATARHYAIGKTAARIALGEIGPHARAVVLAAEDSVVGVSLQEPEFAIGGEKFVPLDDYGKVPRHAFRRIWTG